MAHDLLTDFPAGVDGTVILERLSHVLDHELDEPILDLGFVQSLRLCDGQATITLQLPTSWCAINFAFIMAEDVRAALLAADDIQEVVVRVGDHSSARDIEAAVNSGSAFATAFPGEGAAGTAALRMVFLRKGFLVRQERLLRELRATGLADAAISALNIGDGSTVTTGVLRRYMERRAEVGLDCSSDAPLIVDQSGASVPAEQLETYYRRIRTVRVSLEANGSFCRTVLATRRAAPPRLTKTTRP